MLVDKIKNIGSIFNSNKTTPIKESKQVDSKDNIEISDNAKLKAEITSLKNHILNSNEDNSVKLSEIKSKLAAGFYDNLSSDVLNKTADRLTQSFIEKN
jgi:phenylalanyl-tRNA synthetase alpha subunit